MAGGFNKAHGVACVHKQQCSFLRPFSVLFALHHLSVLYVMLSTLHCTSPSQRLPALWHGSLVTCY
jgi:hypothetical protein